MPRQPNYSVAQVFYKISDLGRILGLTGYRTRRLLDTLNVQIDFIGTDAVVFLEELSKNKVLYASIEKYILLDTKVRILKAKTTIETGVHNENEKIKDDEVFNSSSCEEEAR